MVRSTLLHKPNPGFLLSELSDKQKQTTEKKKNTKDNNHHPQTSVSKIRKKMEETISSI